MQIVNSLLEKPFSLLLFSGTCLKCWFDKSWCDNLTANHERIWLSACSVQFPSPVHSCVYSKRQLQHVDFKTFIYLVGIKLGFYDEYRQDTYHI